MSESHKLFTYDYFKALMVRAKKIAPITTLKDRKDGLCIVLRHDVDFDVFPAYKLYKIEKEIGVKSSFFLMTTCQFYNVSDASNRKMIKEISDNGYEIGLHFDPTVYGNASHEELRGYMKKECLILETITCQEVVSISLHNPSITGQYPIFDGYNNAYSKEIFSDDVYLSDSCMKFRGKNPIEFVEKARAQMIQIVLHPMHWSQTGNSYIEIFSKYIERNIRSIDTTFSVNPTYIKSLDKRELLEIIFSKGDAK